jgi:hypothetical protein
LEISRLTIDFKIPKILGISFEISSKLRLTIDTKIQDS